MPVNSTAAAPIAAMVASCARCAGSREPGDGDLRISNDQAQHTRVMAIVLD